MQSYLAQQLSAARHRQFIGRAPELELFRCAIAAPKLPFHVLHVFGPGGVGKTSLLGEFAYSCEQVQTPALYLDARHTEPSAVAFLSTLQSALEQLSIQVLFQETPNQSLNALLPGLATQLAGHVVLIDTYEALVPLDDWLRRVFLPQLPETTLVVLAGRHFPAQDWRSDPGWQALVHLLPLDNLSSKESQTYLGNRQVPSAQHQAVLDFTHGHPLALSLVADLFAQAGNLQFQPEAAADVVKTLLEKLVEAVPSSTHQLALEACSLVRLTTETLLAEMLGLSDSDELFEWLRRLSFIKPGQQGLFPYDLTREVLIANLRWRNPDRYIELRQRARNYFTKRLQQSQGQEQQRILLDYIFLHRDNAAVRPYFTWQANTSLLPDILRETDPPALAAIASQHEGEASAHLVSYWLKRQPQGVLVFRDTEKRPAGFVLVIALHQATAEDRSIDPAVHSVWHYLEEQAPLRAGEGATLLRFWMARDTYQAVSPLQSLIFINFMQHHRSTGQLAFTFFPCAEPEFWANLFTYADLERLPDADFEVDGRRYGVYGHDWRVVPPKTWQALLAQREIAASVPVSKLVVLSQAQFARAVKDALHNFSHPHALQANLLLQSRLVMGQVAPQVRKVKQVEALQLLIQEVAGALQSSPREAKLYRALYHTYIHPTSTQEEAAELLDIPFSTFRRHLKTGIDRVTDRLWQLEIGGTGEMSKK